LPLFLFSVANSVVDVAMNAQSVAVEAGVRKTRSIRDHAMHSLGGIVGAGPAPPRHVFRLWRTWDRSPALR
jgi:hypothetical protein